MKSYALVLFWNTDFSQGNLLSSRCLRCSFQKNTELTGVFKT